MSSTGGRPLASAWPCPRCVLKTTSSALQVSTHSHGDGFLPDVGVASPMDQTALMAARQLFFTLPYQLHGAIPRKHLLFESRALLLSLGRGWADGAPAVHGQIAAVHGNKRPGDPACAVGSKKDGEAFDVVWMA